MVLLCLVFLIILVSVNARVQPHIIYILADDLGWNDVGFHGSAQIFTPNIDALAYSGLILNNHYVLPICTPSRAALMTGKYPIYTGMQEYPPLRAGETRALPPGKLLPGYLKDLGYKTNLIGKWHLGYSRLNETPTYRGFDYHLGYWGSHISYYTHELTVDNIPGGVRTGYDMRRNTTVAWDLQGEYATDIFTREAVNIINNHERSEPLFLMLSHLAVHSSNPENYLEVPYSSLRKHNHIIDSARRTYAGMVSKLDDSIGEVMRALERNQMLENSIIVFASDNGAPTYDDNPNWGSNYPLRGIKGTFWEGSVRGVASVWSPLIIRKGVSMSMFHMTDWLPTLISAAGGNPADLNIDGIDQWKWLSQNASNSRNEILINIYEEPSSNEAVRQNQWKLITGWFKDGQLDRYAGESGKRNRKVIHYNVQDVIGSDAAKSISSVQRSLTDDYINQLRKEATVVCPGRDSALSNCIPTSEDSLCLFDLSVDPCEMNDLSAEHPDMVKKLKNVLTQYKINLVPASKSIKTSRGAPEHFNYTWSNFLDL